jgi:hypothetical protein
MRTAALAAALLAGAFVLTGAEAARAGGIPILYNTGEDAFPVADVTDEILNLATDNLVQVYAKENNLDIATADPAVVAQAKSEVLTELKNVYQNTKLGYKCSVFGIFYAYLWWSSCEQVIFREKSATEFEYKSIKDRTSEQDVEALAQAFEKKANGKAIGEAYPLSAAKLGFWKKNGRWILLTVVILLIAAAVARFVLKKKAEAGPPPGVFPPAGGPPGGFPPPGAPPGGFPPPGAPPGGFPPPGAPPGGFPPPGGYQPPR